jgi:tetratricopeptide (TPR) repeat protein
MQGEDAAVEAIRAANALFRAGEFEQAEAALLAGRPGTLAHPVGLALAAMIARGRSRWADALAALDRATALQPADPNLVWLRGATLVDLGRFAEGLAALDAALRIHADNPRAWFDRARALVGLDRAAEAVAALDRAIERMPGFFEALVERGRILRRLGRAEAALASWEAAHRLRPEDLDVARERAAVLVDLNREAEGLAVAEELARRAPEDTTAAVVRCEALLRLERAEPALAAAARLARMPGADLLALEMSGRALMLAGDPAAAVARFAEADAAGYRSSGFSFQYGRALLTLGRWREGFRLTEARREIGAGPIDPEVACRWPAWQGGDPAGLRLLVVEEQGFGDTIQFSRWLVDLARRGAEVSFLVRRRLHRLLASLPAEIDLRAGVGAADRFDAVVPLMSLPGFAGSTPETIPVEVPYLAAEPDRAAVWRDRLGPRRGPRIGIAWEGATRPPAEPGRDFPLAAAAPLAAIPGVRLISLLRETPADPAIPVEPPPAELDAGADGFVDTAALIAALDLVVTCDTSIAHLAGALGRPTFVALKRVADWRWLRGRDDSPFYPSLRVFRQAAPGDWGSVFAAMAVAASALVTASPIRPD